ncbi:sugar phosphate isomerase/epimerase family protein [Thermoanaerobacterium thermosaccharolyticum]|uniref:sugar phosphate isomerase/epimerase family protein n=1 Tax=Thermoanaerobacterium thermosaccharolyticum TaxID=1517 RepID=UPI0020A26BE2
MAESCGIEVVFVNLGIRAHDLEHLSIEKLPEEVFKKGLSSVQLAINKSFPELNLKNGSLSSGLARYIGDSFKSHNIQIAVLGCYVNIIHPDLDERRRSLEFFKEHIRFARDFGCSIVGTETGNVHAKMGFTTDNFREEPFLEVVKSVSELVEEAERFGVFVGIEAGVNHPVYSPKMMKRLMDEIKSSNLQAIFDPTNLLTEENYMNQDTIFNEAFELYGDRIVAVHAKDFTIKNGKLEFVPVGKGLLDYNTIFKFIKYNKPYINILMENTKEPFIDEGILYLRQKYEIA